MPETQYSVEEVAKLGQRTGEPYVEFLRVPAMSAGVYELPVGGVDTQTPHTEDEIYYVLKGQGRFEVEGVERTVAMGDVLFVPARAKHHFHDITRALSLLVVFAPAEKVDLPAR